MTLISKRRSRDRFGHTFLADFIFGQKIDVIIIMNIYSMQLIGIGIL